MGLGRLRDVEKKDNILAIFIVIVVIIVLPSTILINYLGPFNKNFYYDPNYSDSLGQSLHSASNIPIGVAYSAFHSKYNQKFRNIVAYHFNSLTPENAMKMSFLWPGKDVYSWSEADLIVDFAERINATIHGHTLVWHSQVPQWVYSYSGTTEDWKNLLKTYVQTVVRHYKGRVQSWDVVNEAFEEDGFRDTIWYEKIGPTYIADAFRWVREVDPDAKLYYNDYGLCDDLIKLDYVLDFINSSILDGVPIDGIGFQAHIKYNDPDNATLINAINRVKALDIDLRISELDVRMNDDGNYDTFTYELSQLQKDYIEDFINIVLNYSKTTGITLWGVSDAESWHRMGGNLDWPLLFDESYKPKPAAFGFLNALKNN